MGGAITFALALLLLGGGAFGVFIAASPSAGMKPLLAAAHTGSAPLDASAPAVAAPAVGNGLLPTNAPPAIEPESMPDSADRVADARRRRVKVLREKLAAAGLTYPPREIFLRAFKQEGQLEVWARSAANPAEALRLVATYPIQRASGKLGPKRREGDQQVPEGFYLIDRFNPRSLFHLSLGLNYPNASDLLLTADPQHPGSDVYIHGGAESIGCMAMGDAAAEEIFLLAADARAAGQRTLAAHVFPCRLTSENWQTLLAPRAAAQPGLAEFWRNLQPAYDQFEQTRRVPRVRVEADGQYTLAAGGAGN